MLILAGNASRPLAERVSTELGVELGRTAVSILPDSETSVCIDSPLAGADVYIMQSLAPPVNQSLLEALLLADACYRGHTERITLVVPYLAYTRQERLSRSGMPISTQLLASLLAAAKIDRIVTLDLHNPASVGLFAQPLYNLTSVSLFAPLLEGFDDLLVIAPDHGGKQRAAMLAARLGCEYLCIDKRSDQQEYMKVNCALAVQGRDCVLYDDICVSGRTLLWARDLLRQQGAKSISMVVTHALFSESAAAEFMSAELRLFACTDSVSVASSNMDRVAVREQQQTVSIASMLAQTITALRRGDSLPASIQSYA